MASNNRFTEEYIKRHINFYTSAAVSSKGKSLYNSGRVFFKEYIDRTDTWKFVVQGSTEYQVIVKGANSQNIATSCTCPFDWGNICKHSVAALLFVSDNLDNQFNLLHKQQTQQIVAPPSKRNGQKLGFEIPNYQKLDLDFVRKNVSVRVLNQLMYTQFQFEKIEITTDLITFVAPNPTGNVSFYLEDNKVYITSPLAVSNLTQLTVNEACCIKLIANSPLPGFLIEVFNGNIKNREKEMLKDYGLSENANFNEYFFYGFDEKTGLKYYLTTKSHGLIPVVNSKGNYFLGLLEKLNSDDLELDKLTKKNEHVELGFVIRKSLPYDYRYRNYYDDFDDDNQNEHYEIVAIVGKTRKNDTSALATHIKEYEDGMDDKFVIQKSENAEKLLKLIDKLDDDRDNFQLLKNAFELLQNEKFVYGLAKGADKVRKKDLLDITLSPEPVDIVFEVAKTKDFLTLALKLKIGGNLLNRKSKPTKTADNYFYATDNTYHLAKSEKVAQMIAEFPENIRMVAAYKEEFFKNVVEPISKNFEVRYKNGTFKSETIELDFNKKQLFLSEQNEYVVFTPRVEYDHNVSAVLYTTGNILVKNGDEITEYRRNFELEDDFLDTLAELHPDFETQKSRKLFYLHYNDFTKNMWFYKFFDQLQSNNIEVFGLKDLKNFKYSPYKGKISTSVSSGQDWFEVDISISFGDMQVTLNDIKKAVLNQQRYIQLKDGSVGILPSEWLHKLEKYFRNGEIKKDKLEISKLRFSVIDELFDNIDDTTILQEITEKRQRLKNFTNIENTEVPKQITANLRHYQKEGLNWLNFLDEMQWGGILADDMGLGKTLQILAFLQLQTNKKMGTNLIVVPTTLLFNWQNELNKFAPKLKAFFYYGVDREKSTNDFKKYDLVITTYGILLRDIETLGKFQFNYAILDESQAIKNPLSHRYKAASLINARNKIALTGTPIENGTFDLFSQMSFANRGFFGGAQKFRENYSTPIDKDGNEIIANELNKIINPFVLRRTKENVASELPDKTEDIIYCEMETGQRRVYDAYRNEYRNQLLNKIETEGLGKSKMMVLEALTRLRQICDSPVLLNSDEVAETQSVKIKEIVRHITNKTGKHKILVFSQFVKMLGLIKDELAKLNIEYEYLDGQCSSQQREQSVNNFQENENLRVFLISLKAGGTGLNLTAADYVYIVDPWWNPAVENQAIDRCYRIGQDKKVFAYRMICTNTVEEKIVALQNKKKKIAGDIIQTDENILQKFDKNDIAELFS